MTLHEIMQLAAVSAAAVRCSLQVSPCLNRQQLIHLQHHELYDVCLQANLEIMMLDKRCFYTDEEQALQVCCRQLPTCPLSMCVAAKASASHGQALRQYLLLTLRWTEGSIVTAVKREALPDQSPKVPAWAPINSVSSHTGMRSSNNLRFGTAISVAMCQDAYSLCSM